MGVVLLAFKIIFEWNHVDIFRVVKFNHIIYMTVIHFYFYIVCHDKNTPQVIFPLYLLMNRYLLSVRALTAEVIIPKHLPVFSVTLMCTIKHMRVYI